MFLMLELLFFEGIRLKCFIWCLILDVRLVIVWSMGKVIWDVVGGICEEEGGGLVDWGGINLYKFWVLWWILWILFDKWWMEFIKDCKRLWLVVIIVFVVLLGVRFFFMFIIFVGILVLVVLFLVRLGLR